MKNVESSLLRDYIKKRDFNKTSEPEAVLKSKSSGDFMVHLHDARKRHYDLRLQWKGVLKCWAIPKGPSYDTSDKRLAVRTEDHPDDYKNYEGVIPEKQYGAGPSLIWDAGDFIPLENFDKGLKKGHLRFALDGVKLKGAWNLIRMKNQKKENWLLIKEDDEFANWAKKNKKMFSQEEWDASVATGRGLKDLESEDTSKEPTPRKTKNLSKMPKEVKPQLALRQSKVPEGDNWLYERKYDGYRVLAFIKDGEVVLKTRNNKDWTDKFPAIVSELKALPIKDAIFDGEIVHFDRRDRTDFGKLQNFLNSEDIPLHYVLFDVLFAGEQDLQNVPLKDRRNFLERLYSEFPKAKSILLSETLPAGKDLLERACKHKWEGIIAKQKSSIYHNSRHSSWLKIKCGNREEFVVIGLTPPQKSRSHFGSLLIAEKGEAGLEYRGKVGTGFDEKDLKKLTKTFKEFAQKSPPDVKGLEKTDIKFWLKPHFFIEVDYSERTTKGLLRHPVFKGLRQDKDYTPAASSDRIPSEIKLSNPDKVLFKDMGLTKLELWNYYEMLLPQFMRFAQNAPLTLVRCPQGAQKKCFYQKHPEQSKDHPKLIQIKEENKTAPYAYLQSADDLKALVQLGVLEFHVWNSRVSDIERPLYGVFDLDPDEEIEFKAVIEAAHLIRETLESDNRQAYVRTTGGKGLHVLTPVKNMSWKELKQFTRDIADELTAEQPDKYIATSSKAKRKGKVFIDYLRNSRGATSVTNYSTRAKPGATVATPLFWDEVTEDLDPKVFNVETVPQRLSEQSDDPWEGFYKHLQL